MVFLSPTKQVLDPPKCSVTSQQTIIFSIRQCLYSTDLMHKNVWKYVIMPLYATINLWEWNRISLERLFFEKQRVCMYCIIQGQRSTLETLIRNKAKFTYDHEWTLWYVINGLSDFDEIWFGRCMHNDSPPFKFIAIFTHPPRPETAKYQCPPTTSGPSFQCMVLHISQDTYEYIPQT
jgi:hypothetical protein